MSLNSLTQIEILGGEFLEPIYTKVDNKPILEEEGRIFLNYSTERMLENLIKYNSIDINYSILKFEKIVPLLKINGFSQFLQPYLKENGDSYKNIDESISIQASILTCGGLTFSVLCKKGILELLQPNMTMADYLNMLGSQLQEVLEKIEMVKTSFFNSLLMLLENSGKNTSSLTLEFETEEQYRNNITLIKKINGLEIDRASNRNILKELLQEIHGEEFDDHKPSFHSISLEKVIDGRYIAIRHSKQWKNKGRVYWYDLNQCKPIKEKEIKNVA